MSFLQVVDALFNLLAWICAAGVLAALNTAAIWYGFKIADKVRAVLWARQQKKKEEIRKAFNAGYQKAINDYARAKDKMTADRPQKSWRLANQSIEDLCREALGDKEAA